MQAGVSYLSPNRQDIYLVREWGKCCAEHLNEQCDHIGQARNVLWCLWGWVGLVQSSSWGLNGTSKFVGVLEHHAVMGWSRLIQGLADLLGLSSLLCADPVKGTMSSVGWYPAAVALTSRNCWHPSASHGMCFLFHCCSHPETRLHTVLQSSS